MVTQFGNPPVENRPRPFWFFNGDMDRDEVEKQVLELKDKGLGGFFLCARQGLKVPYLSEDWFDLCRYTVGLAKEHGMEVWLYDEYPYPSGMSGGEVTLRHPEAVQRELVFTDRIVAAGPVELGLGEVRILHAMAYPVRQGKTCWDEGTDIGGNIGILQNQQVYQRTMLANSVHNTKRYFSYGPCKELRWQAPAGQWRVIVASEKTIDDFKYYGNFLDPAHPAAVQEFIGTTYEPYKKALGEDFGGVVKGMFGDETGYLGDYPWSVELCGYYKTRWEDTLENNLPALLDNSYPNAAAIRYRYFQSLHELLRDRYHKPLSEWCAKNHIAYVTEIPSLRMSNQMYSHVPGGDPNHDKLGFPLEAALDRDLPGLRSNAKVLSAIARQFGRRDSLIESFHSIGWSMTLQDAKWQIDRETLMGISLHNFHAYYYTLDGITKHDAPPSQFHQNPYWAYYKLFADYCGRSSRYITETESSAQVAVLHPVTSWWTNMINMMHRITYAGKDAAEEKRVQRLIGDYIYLCKSLFFGGVDYDDLDAEVLALARIENGKILIGKASYDTLVLPPLENLEGYALRLVEQFVNCGGKLVACGLTPGHILEGQAKVFPYGRLTGEEYYGAAGKPTVQAGGNVTLLSAPGGLVEAGANKLLVQTVLECCPPAVRVEIPENLWGKVIASRREDGRAKYVMLSSQDGVDAVCRLSSPGDVAYVELDLEKGTLCRLQYGGVLEVALAPWQSRIIGVMHEDDAIQLEDAVPQLHTSIFVPDLSRPMKVKAKGENVLRLEALALSVQGSGYKPVTPHMFTEQMEQAGLLKGEHITFVGGFGLPRRPKVKYPISASYRIPFHVAEVPAGIFLMHDEMGIMGAHSISINGKRLARDAFAKRFVYDQNNLVADISGLVQAGGNVIQVDVQVEEDWHGISDPLYLLGGFGVYADEGRFVIGKATDEARFTAKAVEGYPFYSGELTFTAELDIPADATHIALPGDAHIHECVSVQVDGTGLGARAFAPYVWPLPQHHGGKARVEITMANTLINLLEGAYFDYSLGKTMAIEP